MVKAKKYILLKYFEGVPKASHVKLIEEELPPLKNGEFLAEAVYISVDPYMRIYKEILKENALMPASQVALITESKSKKFPVGKHVLGYFGWRTHTIVNEVTNKVDFSEHYLLPDFQGLPLSLALGALGMPGNTAYFGLLEICNPKEGETVVVTAAAGSVGSHVGQIAKIKGCKVVGIAGSDEKGKWLTDELGFDHFINYKTQDVGEALKKCAPEGIDCYFDNVGGVMSSTILAQMNHFGRVTVCGAISGYNDDSPPPAPSIQVYMLLNELKMEGIIVRRWNHRILEGIEQNMKWIKEGKLKYKETVTHGFENIFSSFVGMLTGENTGKALVKV